ncbi:OmpA family protein [Pendulispora albinea]|uniref:OmpA family protein n=1 Tax=Pendulispora albinea TaxID=2741071 RepID=A0ABZ2LRQ8_9BACT
MIRAYSKIAASLALTTFVAGCGSTPPPKELLEARAAYEKAQKGQANQINPAQVHVAKQALDQAEKAYDDSPGAPETSDRAYIALRKAQLAEAQAGMMAAERERDQAQKDLGKKTGQELESARKQLEAEQQRSKMTQQQLEEERRRTKEALDNLAKMAEVKNDNRGMVITLSGQVLFASGASALLPAAMSALDNVVTALKANPDRNITIEGHTDSQGQRSFNMDLSQKRADSVRQYISSHGIPSEIIRAVGVGPDRPVASNSTAEGRANNRRVEIIVSPPERK